MHVKQNDDYEQSLTRLPDPSVVLATLRRNGLLDSTDEFAADLSIALMHISLQSELGKMAPQATRGVLDALGAAGGSFVRRAAALHAYRTNGPQSTSSALSTLVSRTATFLPEWAQEQRWISQSMGVGRSFETTAMPAKVFVNVLHQVLGLLVVYGHDSCANTLIKDLLHSTTDASIDRGTDVRTLLKEQLGSQEPVMEYERQGPDHDPEFTATITTADGRTCSGVGKGKRLAARAACAAYLKRYFPDALAPKSGQSSVPSARELPAGSAHRNTVTHVQNLFHLPPAARPLLSQAMVHTSWSYENKKIVDSCGQRNNQALAFLGSTILAHEHALAAGRAALESRPDQSTLRTIANDVIAAAFWQTDLRSGILLGMGQKTIGVPTELASNTFQAVVAAIYLGKESPACLADSWPAVWMSTLAELTPTVASPHDPTTQLQQVCSAVGLRIDYAFEQFGPANKVKYWSHLTLESEPLDDRLVIVGPQAQRKTPAKHAVSLLALSALENIRDIPRLSDSRIAELSLERFLVRHLVGALSTNLVSVSRWRELDPLGLRDIQEARRRISWAQALDSLLRDEAAASRNPDQLTNSLRSILGYSEPKTHIKEFLQRTLAALEQIETTSDIDDRKLSQLVDLCGVYRAIGAADDPRIGSQELLAEWRLLHRGRVATGQTFEPLVLAGHERAMLDRAVHHVLDLAPAATIEILASSDLQTVRVRPSTLVDLAVGSTWEIWSTLEPLASFSIDKEFEIRLPRPRLALQAGLVEQAMVSSYFHMGATQATSMADLLHDLKNQVVAARQADGTPAPSRTAKLEQQLAASRHLDQIASIAKRLRAASDLLRASDEDNSAHIGQFLRSYALSMLNRLPASISLSVPSAEKAVAVPLGHASLTAILDNLVANAIEAMTKGTIRLSWSVRDQNVIVEVADTGPGLQPEVAAAIQQRRRIPSTKAGGNGIGVLGVRALLEAVGGRLAFKTSAAGTTWLLVLPLVEAPTTQGD